MTSGNPDKTNGKKLENLLKKEEEKDEKYTRLWETGQFDDEK